MREALLRCSRSRSQSLCATCSVPTLRCTAKRSSWLANVGVDEALLPAAQVLVLICTNRNTLMPPDLLSIYCSYSLQALQAMQGVRHQDLTVSNGSMKVLAVAQS